VSFTVAIIGRPNVGKSTFFNRLIGKKLALVHDEPGVTRDRREGQGGLGDMTFRVIDTAGLEDALDDSLEGRMRRQTNQAISEADVVLFLIDARAGVTPLDRHFAAYLRKSPTPVILVANKCEGQAGQPGLMEAYSLGLGDPLPLSAEHGDGMMDLFSALLPYEQAAQALGEPEKQEEAPLQLAIVGRPNVGKSTLVNRLLGEDRMLTGPEAGITRDSVYVDWSYQGRRIRLVDTAGMRRRSKVTEALEKLAVADGLSAVDRAQVVVLVLDADAVLDKQDLVIARRVIDEGRALVIAINKWDAAKDREASLQRLSDRLQTSLPQVRGIPTVTLSALTGKGVDKLMEAVFAVYEVWNIRVPTGALNRWFDFLLENHPPPLGKHKIRIKLRYITQACARPPTFVVFGAKVEELPDSYVRYMVNGLRQDFHLDGVPIRLHLRGGKNPYAPT